MADAVVSRVKPFTCLKEGAIELVSHGDDRAARIVSTFGVGGHNDEVHTTRETLALVCGRGLYNRGLLVSWLLVFLPVFGASLSFVGVGLQSPALAEQVALIMAIPLAAALLLGTAGYLLGRGVKHILRSAGTEPA